MDGGLQPLPAEEGGLRQDSTSGRKPWDLKTHLCLHVWLLVPPPRRTNPAKWAPRGPTWEHRRQPSRSKNTGSVITSGPLAPPNPAWFSKFSPTVLLWKGRKTGLIEEEREGRQSSKKLKSLLETLVWLRTERRCRIGLLLYLLPSLWFQAKVDRCRSAWMAAARTQEVQTGLRPSQTLHL